MIMKPLLKSQKTEFESTLLVVIMLVATGVIIVFMSHVNHMFYSKMEKYLAGHEKYNNTEAHRVAQDIVRVEESSMWDYASLFILMGLIANMLIFSFATRISPVFFWLFVLMSTTIVFTAVILSNIWQTWSANPEFAETIQRFPITNALLGNYLVPIALGVIFLGLIVLFGKMPPELGGEKKGGGL